MLKFIGGLVVLVGADLLNGWVLSILWRWFIVPTFNLPHLQVVPAMGIAVVVSHLTGHGGRSNSQDDDEESLGETVVKNVFYSVITSFLALFVGWVIHFFL